MLSQAKLLLFIICHIKKQSSCNNNLIQCVCSFNGINFLNMVQLKLFTNSNCTYPAHIFYCIYFSISYIFKMFGRLSLAIVCQLLITIKSLHLLDTTQAQIDALKAQQSSFENTVNKLITNISNVEKSINSTSSIDQKVIILENAILSQRQSVFELSKIIIPPFNISKDGCQKMTDQQKVELLEQLDNARKQVYQLRNISATLPKCDDVDVIKRDIEKQLFFLNSIESIIYTNCSMNVILSQTIFQTNIYAPNWLLGNMTIDDLIQQYYQRSIRYDNITNCPIDFPFFDGKQCIQCPSAQPAFDISQKKCVACPPQYHIDNNQKKCVPDVHYTNWTTVSNFAPENGPFPTPAQGATPCPSDKPYYDGTVCIKCVLPQYFDINANACKNCSQGQVFDKNTKTCVEAKKNYLTVLSGTRWVTGVNNFTNVLKQRAAILQANKTSGIYQDCPTQTPYYDGITCISCSYEFDLNTLKCVSAPNGTQYDDNIHSYIPPQTGETVPTAPNLLGTPPADDPNVVNCNKTAPYWDGVACIQCPQPFILFDLNTKKCVACDPQSYYDNKTRSCVPRPIIYISNNDTKLLATPNRTIAQYHDNVTNTIQNNPEAILVNCPDPAQYSNYNQCFTCASTEYFNVQTFKCEPCAHAYDPVTKQCIIKATNFTNLQAPNIVNLTDPVKEQQYINNQLASNPDNRVCDISLPYWNGVNCVTCVAPEINFDYSQKKCVGCGSGYYISNNQCVAAPYVSNVTAIPNGTFVQTAPNATLAAITNQVNSYKASGTPYIECPAATPIYNTTSKTCVSLCPAGLRWDIKTSACAACPQGQYMAQNGSCVAAPYVSNIPVISSSPYIQTLPNATLANLSQPIKAYQAAGIPYIECPTATPIFSTTQNKCVQSCPNGTQLDLATMKCIVCQNYIAANHSCPTPQPRYPNLTAGPWTSNNVSNVIAWRDNLTQVPGAQPCPASQPYYNGYVCLGCQSGQYYDYDTLQCKSCPAGQVFNPNNLTCVTPTNTSYQTNPNSPNLIYGTKPYNQLVEEYNVNKTNGVVDCPPEYPYKYTYGCTNCLDNTYQFHLDYQICTHCPAGTTYNYSFKNCVSDTTNQPVNISPDIAKMYANIF